MQVLQQRFRRFIVCVLVLLILVSGTMALASVPYTSYVYDADRRPVEAPDAYTITGTIDGVHLGVGAFNKPQDIFKDSSGSIYVVDTGNNRILELAKDLKTATEIKSFTYNGKAETLNAPQNVFVTPDGTLYISDTGNKRIVISNKKGEIRQIIHKPDSDLFGDKNEFKPNDLVVSSAGTMYVLVEGIYQGAVMFNAEGKFTGYYGSNKVQANLSLLADYFWKSFMTAEQRSRMKRYVPVQYSSLQIDSEDFIYLTTEASENASERVRKLNPLGQNILRSANNTKVFYGDPGSFQMQGETNSTTLVSIDVVSDKYITVLDQNQKRIFQYSQECDLLTVFGCAGTMLGAFVEPVGLCGYDDKIFVLDAQKNAVTVFELTQYGKTLHNAIDIYNDGRYQESLPYWYDILKYNSSSMLANRGVGKALYQVGKSQEAMQYFEKCDEKTGYSAAFNDVRRSIIRQNFTWIIVGIVAGIIGLYLIIKLRVFPRLWSKLRKERTS